VSILEIIGASGCFFLLLSLVFDEETEEFEDIFPFFGGNKTTSKKISPLNALAHKISSSLQSLARR
tara:strand:- start:157 stop:354 length:198 start_codon:yes stop_codon:yes gene_type:complete